MKQLRTPYLNTLKWLIFVALIASSAGAPLAIGFDPLSEPVTVKGFLSLTSVPPGGSIQAAIGLEMSGHWHVNANKTNDEYLIPTTVAVTAPPGVAVRQIVYPAGVEKKLAFSEKPLMLYEGEAYIGIVLDVSPDALPGDVSITATVTYQACDNEKCLAPKDEKVTIPIRISPPTEAIDATHSEIFAGITFPDGSAAGGVSAAKGGRIGQIISRRGYFIAFFFVFLWGLALNLTPCVYPIIPITVGYFGSQSGGKSSRTFLLAGIYVLGMSVMYSSLGLVASLTGGMLGSALQNPFVTVFVALVFVGLALSSFGLYEIRVPMRLANLAGSSSGMRGWPGAFFTGLTVGIVAAPCIGPLVLALLTFVGESGDPLLGFSMFFTLSMGLGFPYLFLAVLSGNISKLPKSGEWMEWVKKLFGMVLIGMAVFFLQPIISDAVYYLLVGLVFIAAGILLGFILKTHSNSLVFNVFKRFVGVAAPIMGLYLIFWPGHVIAPQADEGGIVWSTYNDDLLLAAKEKQQFVLIDFTAEWCLPCKELDHKTFSPVEVIDATLDVVTLRADLTQSASEEVAVLRKAFSIRGVPTVIFIDKNGKERSDLRVFGFVDKDEFLKRIDKLKNGT